MVAKNSTARNNYAHYRRVISLLILLIALLPIAAATQELTPQEIQDLTAQVEKQPELIVDHPELLEKDPSLIFKPGIADQWYGGDAGAGRVGTRREVDATFFGGGDPAGKEGLSEQRSMENIKAHKEAAQKYIEGLVQQTGGATANFILQSDVLALRVKDGRTIIVNGPFILNPANVKTPGTRVTAEKDGGFTISGEQGSATISGTDASAGERTVFLTEEKPADNAPTGTIPTSVVRVVTGNFGTAQAYDIVPGKEGSAPKVSFEKNGITVKIGTDAHGRQLSIVKSPDDSFDTRVEVTPEGFKVSGRAPQVERGTDTSAVYGKEYSYNVKQDIGSQVVFAPSYEPPGTQERAERWSVTKGNAQITNTAPDSTSGAWARIQEMNIRQGGSVLVHRDAATPEGKAELQRLRDAGYNIPPVIEYENADLTMRTRHLGSATAQNTKLAEAQGKTIISFEKLDADPAKAALQLQERRMKNTQAISGVSAPMKDLLNRIKEVAGDETALGAMLKNAREKDASWWDPRDYAPSKYRPGYLLGKAMEADIDKLPSDDQRRVRTLLDRIDAAIADDYSPVSTGAAGYVKGWLRKGFSDLTPEQAQARDVRANLLAAVQKNSGKIEAVLQTFTNEMVQTAQVKIAYTSALSAENVVVFSPVTDPEYAVAALGTVQVTAPEKGRQTSVQANLADAAVFVKHSAADGAQTTRTDVILADKKGTANLRREFALGGTSQFVETKVFVNKKGDVVYANDAQSELAIGAARQANQIAPAEQQRFKESVRLLPLAKDTKTDITFDMSAGTAKINGRTGNTQTGNTERSISFDLQGNAKVENVKIDLFDQSAPVGGVKTRDPISGRAVLQDINGRITIKNEGETLDLPITTGTAIRQPDGSIRIENVAAKAEGKIFGIEMPQWEKEGIKFDVTVDPNTNQVRLTANIPENVRLKYAGTELASLSSTTLGATYDTQTGEFHGSLRSFADKIKGITIPGQLGFKDVNIDFGPQKVSGTFASRTTTAGNINTLAGTGEQRVAVEGAAASTLTLSGSSMGKDNELKWRAYEAFNEFTIKNVEYWAQGPELGVPPTIGVKRVVIPDWKTTFDETGVREVQGRAFVEATVEHGTADIVGNLFSNIKAETRGKTITFSSDSDISIKDRAGRDVASFKGIATTFTKERTENERATGISDALDQIKRNAKIEVRQTGQGEVGRDLDLSQLISKDLPLTVHSGNVQLKSVSMTTGDTGAVTSASADIGFENAKVLFKDKTLGDIEAKVLKGSGIVYSNDAKTVGAKSRILTAASDALTEVQRGEGKSLLSLGGDFAYLTATKDGRPSFTVVDPVNFHYETLNDLKDQSQKFMLDIREKPGLASAIDEWADTAFAQALTSTQREQIKTEREGRAGARSYVLQPLDFATDGLPLKFDLASAKNGMGLVEITKFEATMNRRQDGTTEILDRKMLAAFSAPAEFSGDGTKIRATLDRLVVSENYKPQAGDTILVSTSIPDDVKASLQAGTGTGVRGKLLGLSVERGGKTVLASAVADVNLEGSGKSLSSVFERFNGGAGNQAQLLLDEARSLAGSQERFDKFTTPIVRANTMKFVLPATGGLTASMQGTITLPSPFGVDKDAMTATVIGTFQEIGAGTSLDIQGEELVAQRAGKPAVTVDAFKVGLRNNGIEEGQLRSVMESAVQGMAEPLRTGGTVRAERLEAEMTDGKLTAFVLKEGTFEGIPIFVDPSTKKTLATMSGTVNAGLKPAQGDKVIIDSDFKNFKLVSKDDVVIYDGTMDALLEAKKNEVGKTEFKLMKDASAGPAKGKTDLADPLKQKLGIKSETQVELKGFELRYGENGFSPLTFDMGVSVAGPASQASDFDTRFAAALRGRISSAGEIVYSHDGSFAIKQNGKEMFSGDFAGTGDFLLKSMEGDLLFSKLNLKGGTGLAEGTLLTQKEVAGYDGAARERIRTGRQEPVVAAMKFSLDQEMHIVVNKADSRFDLYKGGEKLGTGDVHLLGSGAKGLGDGEYVVRQGFAGVRGTYGEQIRQASESRLQQGKDGDLVVKYSRAGLERTEVIGGQDIITATATTTINDAHFNLKDGTVSVGSMKAELNDPSSAVKLATGSWVASLKTQNIKFDEPWQAQATLSGVALPGLFWQLLGNKEATLTTFSVTGLAGKNPDGTSKDASFEFGDFKTIEEFQRLGGGADPTKAAPRIARQYNGEVIAEGTSTYSKKALAIAAEYQQRKQDLISKGGSPEQFTALTNQYNQILDSETTHYFNAKVGLKPNGQGNFGGVISSFIGNVPKLLITGDPGSVGTVLWNGVSTAASFAIPGGGMLLSTLFGPTPETSGLFAVGSALRGLGRATDFYSEYKNPNYNTDEASLPFLQQTARTVLEGRTSVRRRDDYSITSSDSVLLQKLKNQAPLTQVEHQRVRRLVEDNLKYKVDAGDPLSANLYRVLREKRLAEERTQSSASQRASNKPQVQSAPRNSDSRGRR